MSPEQKAAFLKKFGLTPANAQAPAGPDSAASGDKCEAPRKVNVYDLYPAYYY